MGHCPIFLLPFASLNQHLNRLEFLLRHSRAALGGGIGKPSTLDTPCLSRGYPFSPTNAALHLARLFQPANPSRPWRRHRKAQHAPHSLSLADIPSALRMRLSTLPDSFSWPIRAALGGGIGKPSTLHTPCLSRISLQPYECGSPPRPTLSAGQSEPPLAAA
jgi:hypothetical protein